MCAHTQGRNLTSASSVAAASSPPGSSSPMRKHTQVIVCLSWDCMVLDVFMELCTTATTHFWDIFITLKTNSLLLRATTTCFRSLVSLLDVLWNWNPTTRGLCQWLLSLSSCSRLIHRVAWVSELHSSDAQWFSTAWLEPTFCFSTQQLWTFEVFPFGAVHICM